MKLMNVKTFNALCAEIGKATGTLRDKVQEAAVVAIGYSMLHGDITAGQRLIDSISHHKTLRKDSLIAYFERYGAFAWSKADKKLKYAKRDEQFNAAYVEMLGETPWVEAKREAAPVSIYDVEDAFAKFFKRMQGFVGDQNVQTKHRPLYDRLWREYLRYVSDFEAEPARVAKARAEGAEEVTIPQPKAA